MKQSVSIGADLGHSSVKISVKSGNKVALSKAMEIFPTVVRNWTSIANEDTAKKAEADTVTVNGRKYFIGATAARQGQAENFSGQNRNWVETEQHDALLVGAWSRAFSILEKNYHPSPEQITLVLGLPASYFVEQRGPLRARAKSLLSQFLKPHQTLEVLIESQSRGPLACVAFDTYGAPTGHADDDESWGTVEIGHFTSDFTFMDRGQEVDSAASSAKGVHMIYDLVASTFKQKGFLSDFDTITEALQTKSIKYYNSTVDVSALISPAIHEFSSYILDEVGKRFGDKAQRMNGVIVAGGGAYIVGEDIKAKYPNARIPANPRFAVAEGYARIGLLTLT